MDNFIEKTEITLINSSESKSSSTSQYGRTWRRRNKKRRIRKQGIYSYAVDGNPVLVKLNQWLRSKGFALPSGSRLRPAFFPNIGRGLMTTVGVNAGDVLVSIPKQALVTCCRVLEDADFQRFIKVPQKFRAMEILTIFLLYHMYLGDISEWKPYLDSLPKTYTVPAYCSVEEIGTFPEFLKSRIYEQVEDVDQCFASLQKILLKNSKYKQRFSNLCVGDVKWGWFTVNTRAVYLKEKHPTPFISDEDVYALAPFLDLLNHSSSAQVTTGMNESNDCYEIVTQVPFGPYEQVFINYGPHDNIKLYVEYGFIIPENPHTYIPVELNEIISSVTCIINNHMRKASLCEKNKIILAHHINKNLGISMDGPSWNLKVAMTICLMTPEELSQWQVVYEDLDGVSHRKLVAKCLAHVIEQKALQLQMCLLKAENLQECSEAFGVGKDLLRECCMLLENIKMIEDE